MVTAVKTRRLSDLYRRGVEVTVADDEGDDPVRVWLQKLNPVENESAIRAANAYRARVLMKKRQPDSEEFLATMNEVIDYSPEDLVQYLAVYKVATEAEALEAEYAEEKDWTKDDYLQGLRDSWEEGGLKERYFAQDKENDILDPEAQTCFDEIERFTTGVDARLEQERTALAKDYEQRSHEELQEMVMDQIFRMQADLQWMMEYHKMELYLGVRNPENHKERYFEARAEVDELEAEVVGRLVEEYQTLTVGVTEGKDLPEKEDSSSASKPQETEQVPVSSGLKE